MKSIHGIGTSLYMSHKYDEIDLRDQHEKISKCAALGVPEAVIFLVARCTEHIVVTMTARALGYQVTGARLANCAELLLQANLLPLSTMCWINTVRRLGNNVRHSPIKPTSGAMALAMVLYTRIVLWAAEKDQAAGIPPTNFEPVDGGDKLRQAVKLVEFYENNRRLPGGRFSSSHANKTLSCYPDVAAAMCEILLNRDKSGESLELACAALKADPDSIRLQQLRALAYSRMGDRIKGLEIVELLLRQGHRDDETLGIGAGIYKRLGSKERSRTKLQLAHDFYSEVWRRSSPKLLYHGANAAATALYLGHGQLCRSYAASVHDAALHRIARSKATNLQSTGLNLWDGLSHAEALLLMGRLSEASACYREMFEAGKMEPGMVKIAKLQLKSNARHMHLDVEKLLTRIVRHVNGRSKKRIYVLGHRNWKLSVNARSAFLTAVNEVAGEKKRSTIVSNMAAGADQILPRIAIDEGLCGYFLACLPLEIGQLYSEMSSASDRERFTTLLSEADEIRVELASEKEAQSGDIYSRANKWALANCDALIAVWDGQPARGPGGTGETVNLAKNAGVPVWWISNKTGQLHSCP